MGYAKTTPAGTRRAVSAYLGQLRFVGAATALLLGGAAGVAIAIAFMAVDRYVEYPTDLRMLGPWLAGLAILAGAIGAAYSLVRKHDPFGVAVRLDQAFPQHRDRWSSSIDLAAQIESGKNAGDKASLERLFADTESLSTKGVGSIVSKRPLWLALGACAVVGAGAALFRASPAFDVPLLWTRFLNPTADLPRDSATRIVITQVNTQPFAGQMPDALPEGSPLALRIELRHKPGLLAFGSADLAVDPADQLAPRLEQHTADGKRSIEFSRTGTAWVFSQVRLDESLEFRIRADDGLTQTLRAEVTPRIKLTSMNTGIRYPRYSRIKEQPSQPLQGNRISALTDSVVDFQAKFDRPFKSVTATYEAMKAEKDPNAVVGVPVGQMLGTKAPKDPSEEASRRELRIQKRDGNIARFTLPLDSSGILRVKAMGENGLASEEWVCAIESVPDAPPRIVVTGLDPVTTIVPGETFSFQYKAEDDLSVTDIVMDWSVAGGIHSSELGGDEYLKNDRLGQKTVSGQELIQRMNYKFYATEPFQFFLTAIDSKGQESHSDLFRVFTTSDDYATRFERGMTLLKDVGDYQKHYVGEVSALNGTLNIIATGLGNSKKWDSHLDSQLENFLQTARNYDDSWFFVKHLTLRYGGVPYRLNRSLQMLLAVPDLMASKADLLTLASSLRTTSDVPTLVRQLRELLDGQRPILDAWGTAIEAEKIRFLPESLLNQARSAASRLAGLGQIQQDLQVTEANLKFYLSQVDQWIVAAASITTQNPDLVPLLSDLKVARDKSEPQGVVAALQPIVEKLSSRDLGPSDALAALSVAMTRTPPGISDPADRFATVVGRMAFGAGQNELLRPFETLSMAQALISASASPAWYDAPPSAADALMMSHQVWETLRAYRADLIARRFDLNPQEGLDREAILRERALSTRTQLLRLTPTDMDSGVRDRLASVMERMTKPGNAATDASLPADLTRAIHMVGVKPIADLDTIWRASVSGLVGTLRKTADEYEQHSKAVGAEAAAPATEDADLTRRILLLDEAQRLQTRTEGLESLYRSLKLAWIESKLAQPGAAPDWSAMEPLHGAQLNLSLAASQAGEGIVRLHLELAGNMSKAAVKYPIAAKNALDLARRLRTSAQIIESASQGKPVEVDYQALMTEARAEGLMTALKEEYQLIVAKSGPPSPAAADADAKLSKSAMSRIVRAERSLTPLSDAIQQLRVASSAKVSDVAAAIQAVQKSLPAGADGAQLEPLPAAAREAASSPPTEAVAKLPALGRKVGALADAMTNLADGFRDQAKLPSLSTTAQQNRRFTTRDLPNVWVIQGIIEGFDRRWLYTMRDLELSLTRTMLEVGMPDVAIDAANADDLKLQYGRMVEWRARNFANDRRRNQGISLLAAEGGPSVKLPEHIAEEFLRARNLQSPEDFKPRVDAYYEELYHDLAK